MEDQVQQAFVEIPEVIRGARRASVQHFHNRVGSTQVAARRLSSEVFVIPLEAADRFLIYAPLRRVAFVGNSACVNLLADLGDSAAAHSDATEHVELVEFLRRVKIIDSDPERLPITEFAGDPEPTALTLFLTTACNLRCAYCYASAGDMPARSMDLLTAKRGIDYVALNARKNNRKHFELTYHGGGEPTTHWKVLVASFEYAQQRADELGLRAEGFTATNGVLTDLQIDWVTRNLAGASVSFDGLPSAHDANRPTVLGQPSSGRVMRTLHRFDESGLPYGLRVTVTAGQIEALPESVAFVCSNFNPQRIQVEPTYKLGRGQRAPSADSAAFIRAFRSAAAVAASAGRELLFSAARVDVLTNHFCGVTQDTFALSPGGSVSACYEVFAEEDVLADRFFYGASDAAGSGFRFDLHVLDGLRSQAVQYRSFCECCFAKWHCAGDCYHKSLSVDDATPFAGTDRCHITRELTKDQLLARIAAAGGAFWCGAPVEWVQEDPM